MIDPKQLAEDIGLLGRAMRDSGVDHFHVRRVDAMGCEVEFSMQLVHDSPPQGLLSGAAVLAAPAANDVHDTEPPPAPAPYSDKGGVSAFQRLKAVA